MRTQITHHSNPMGDTCRAILLERFGTDEPESLVSFERLQAYELCKKEAIKSARNASDYKQKCQQIVNFLEI